jgi:shikimate 5-dehydrogenase
MKTHHTIIIAGAGGIAEAVALILAEWSTVPPTLFIGNRTLSKAQDLAKWVEDGTTQECTVKAFHLLEEGISEEMKQVFEQGDILLDCLPGTQAPGWPPLLRSIICITPTSPNMWQRPTK